MLEIKKLTITSQENINDFNYSKTSREYKTPRILKDFIEMFNNVNATKKEIKICDETAREIEIDFSYNEELEKIENLKKDLESKQEELSYKAYCEKAREIATLKNALLEKYEILNHKVASYEIVNYCVVNSVSDFVKPFENFIEREYSLSIVIK